ncbi:hypothetical protein J2858_001255 [Neorhizobium galegae]|uniref:hypothetical protein n=1 Tax=Neorhizobium galegae TaxID=399 RepID=UPI001AEAF838|nr:hypothetical protein [Neorhizobium galegae]MBP2548362.1 hypothetical protein [Neorhizobium galegae]
MPHSDVRFYPNILVPSDFAVIDAVIRSIVFTGSGKPNKLDQEKLARIVLRLYRMGLTDPAKLSMFAARLADHARITGSAADRFSASRSGKAAGASPESTGGTRSSTGPRR